MHERLSPAEGAAELRRRAAAPANTPITDLVAFAMNLGVTVRSSRLNSAAGGQDALLVPAAGGGFHAVVDPGCDRSIVDHLHDRLGLGPDMWRAGRWRVAHELAHTLMYRRASPPVRRVPWSAEEEEFCDRVADELLVPRESRWGLDDPEALAARFGVPRSAIARLQHLSASAA